MTMFVVEAAPQGQGSLREGGAAVISDVTADASVQRRDDVRVCRPGVAPARRASEAAGVCVLALKDHE